MCKVVEDMINEELKESHVAIALQMVTDGKLSVDEAAKYFNLSVEEVKELLVEH